MLAPVTGQERAQDKPAERNPDQEASVKGQHADPDQDKHNGEPPARGFIRPDNTEHRSARYVSHETKVLASSDRKTTTLRPRHAVTTHRARSGHVGWLKRVWARLTRPHQFSIAFLHFRDGRR